MYWLLQRQPRSQNVLLIFASYFFYGWWDYRFCVLMLFSSLVDFAIGFRLERTEAKWGRRWLLAVSLVSNLGLLAIFKYYNFFTDSFQQLAGSVGWNVHPLTLQIILPLGISFYTFQTLSYSIDVYRGQLQANRNLIDYLAFVSFFPQLVAGPIERAGRLLPQFARPRQFDPQMARDGCRQILWGFFKKLAVADRLAVVVDGIYADPTAVEGTVLALATFCFAFQIYCDFSAYSDIAIGAAKLFGIQLMRNFAYPYFSQSVSEFWSRWHVSLSTWFRDYVYVPLGGNRCGNVRRACNVLVTFLLSGLWHGAAWRFLCWGGIHGAATLAFRRDGSTSIDGPGGDTLIPRPRTVMRMAATFTVVCSCWVFFRAEDFGEAAFILRRVVEDVFSIAAYGSLVETIAAQKFLRVSLIILSGFIMAEWLQRRRECPLEIGHWSTGWRWSAYTVLLWGTLDVMPDNGGQEFIYFDF